LSLWDWRCCINNLKKQIISFFSIGIFSFSIDAGVYFVLISYIGTGLIFSKTISFMLGTLNSYIFNRTLTFQSNIRHDLGASKHYLVYGFSLLCNVSINFYIVNQLADYNNSYQVAFITATVLSVIINFLGLKFFVFKK
jgi:putative flippase GtrA